MILIKFDQSNTTNISCKFNRKEYLTIQSNNINNKYIEINAIKLVNKLKKLSTLFEEKDKFFFLIKMSQYWVSKNGAKGFENYRKIDSEFIKKKKKLKK